MAKRKLNVVYELKAVNAIFEIYVYIAKKGYVETAIKFTNDLYNLGDSLALFPKKFPVCKKYLLAKRSLRCAVFKKNYIFIYKIVKNKVIIFNIINSSRYVH